MSDTYMIKLETAVESATIAAALTDYGWTPWWAVDMSEPDERGTFTVKWNDDGEQRDTEGPDHTTTVGLWKVAEALAVMATGKYESFDGTMASLNDYHTRAAMDILMNPTEADADADTIDYAVQMAVCGGYLFG